MNVAFVDFFIRRVVFASVCAILIVIAGTVVIPGLPIAQYPQIALPQVVVASSYVGASSVEVESGVTTPLEQQINGVQGMKYITSSSSNDGSSVITVTFDASRDIDLAAVDVQNRVNTALARLPVDVRNLGVTITKNSGAFLGAYALFTSDERYDEKFLSNYADVYMKDRLKRIAGVADVIIFGERRFSMRLWLDPDRLAARNMSPVDVLTALREQNVQVAAGSLGLPPAPSGQTYQISVRALGRLVEASQFEDVVVKSLPDGTIVRLKDVGHAELGAESYSQLSRWNGKRAVGLGIQQLPGSNALDVKKKVDAAMARLAKDFPPGLVYETAFDTTAPVSASIKDVIITLLQAIVLVIATIYLFLQTLRSTLIPAITIPVSLLGTFAFVKLFGFSINTLTLFGLTLATGLVVDDAIVVIENIARVMEQKHVSPGEAASKGMAEVTGAVIATSLVLIAVFVPVAFFPGTTGKIYQQFSLTIAFSIALSAFNAITLTPALSARLLRAQNHRPGARKSIVFRAFDRGFDAVRRGYARGLQLAIRLRAVTLVVFLGLLGATGWLFLHVPQAFIPDEDQGYFIVIVQGPEGASLEVTSNTMRGVEDTLAHVPEIQGCFSVPGFSLLGSGSNKGAIFCTLIPWAVRTKPGQDAMSIVARLRGTLMGVGGALVIPFAPPAIQGVGNVGGFQFEIEDQTSEPKIETLAGATFGLMMAGNQEPNLRGVFSAFTANDPQVVVEVDRERAKALGVSLDEVFATLQIYMGSAYVNDFVFGTRTYRVYVQADKEFRARPTDLTKFYARSATGQMVPLAELVKVTNTATAQSINHYNLFRSTEIQGSPAPGVSSGQALLAMERVAKEHLPPGFAFEWSGLSLEQLESGGQTVGIFALGIVLVFLVLAAQYESFVLPLIIILSVPVAMLGALLLQTARGYSNDVFCQVGLVMLIGMSSKNAILIVEFARELREQGRSVAQAALGAAETRLRPIVMTSMAFLLGVLPLLVATGAGSVGRRSLGTTVFGGMALSTVLNLIFIPVLYVLVETLRERGGRAEPRSDGALVAHVPAMGGEVES
jgi:HAE1 family hydrophobic/amphiphilic exporter-1